nr:aryl hydrocarbon receptor repressor-like [Macaca fascicularis]
MPPAPGSTWRKVQEAHLPICIAALAEYPWAFDFASATLKDNNAGCSADPPMNPGRSEQTFPQVNVDLFSEGDLLLQALNGFLVAVTEDGYIFYVSPTVQDYLGFHQSDVIYQSVFELIHKEDRAMFQSQLRWPPDTASVSREADPDTSRLALEEMPCIP